MQTDVKRGLVRIAGTVTAIAGVTIIYNDVHRPAALPASKAAAAVTAPAALPPAIYVMPATTAAPQPATVIVEGVSKPATVITPVDFAAADAAWLQWCNNGGRWDTTDPHPYRNASECARDLRKRQALRLELLGEQA